MTTSGSVDFSLTRDNIINSAALENADIAEGELLEPERAAEYQLRLNSWVKSLMAGGAKLWAMKQATLFLTAGTATYSLGATGTHCTNSYVQTTLSTDEAASSTSLGLTAFAGMTTGDFIGIVLNDGTIHWTTISGAPGLTTTIATGLASAATAGNVVFTYTTKINRPQRIDTEAANWRSPATQDTPVYMCSRAEYAQLANKTARGKIVQAFYDPQLVLGRLSVWPTPDSASDVLQFWYERILEDFDAASNTPDFAIEWGEALILGLASKMSRTAGMGPQERQSLEIDAGAALALAWGYDRETTSTFFQPDMRR